MELCLLKTNQSFPLYWSSRPWLAGINTCQRWESKHRSVYKTRFNARPPVGNGRVPLFVYSSGIYTHASRLRLYLDLSTYLIKRWKQSHFEIFLGSIQNFCLATDRSVGFETVASVPNDKLTFYYNRGGYSSCNSWCHKGLPARLDTFWKKKSVWYILCMILNT